MNSGNMPVPFDAPGNEEHFPEGKHQSLEARDLLVLKFMVKTTDPDMLYTRDELFDLVKAAGVDEALKSQGFPGLIRYGGRHTILTAVLNNLWWNGRITKFIEGIYVRSGRPYGVKWLIPR